MNNASVYPTRLRGQLDEPLNRGLWLVKWLLAIPHFIVLFFLWISFIVTTVIAGVSILVKGVYPKGIFDFNVGVLRWTWRVSFYAFALGTDRYPPFSLQPDDDYPADFDVEYQQQLSRSLVLVKWWLLALPHYFIIAMFGGGLATSWSWDADGRGMTSGGLIMALALAAGIMLIVKRHYPQGLFEFIMGLERWTYRVLAYATLMRDEYPPFRLDMTEPENTLDAKASEDPKDSTQ